MTMPPAFTGNPRPENDLHAVATDRPRPQRGAGSPPRPNRPNAAVLGLALNGPLLGVTGAAMLLSDRPSPETLQIGLGLQIFLIGVLFLMGLTRAPAPDLAAPAATGPVHAPVEATETWHTCAGPCETGDALRIALIATNTPKTRTIKTALAGPDREIHHCSDGDAMFETVQLRPEGWGLVILDLDTAPGPKAVMHDLADFRAVCPDVPVVLLTGSTLHTDLSTDHRTTGATRPENAVLSRQLAEDLKAADLHFSAGH